MLALSVGMAYIQAFWQTARGFKTGRQLSTLNTTFSALSNPLSMMKMNVWLRYPILFLLATISWSIPISSIITPATLSVEMNLDKQTSRMNVPKLDFTNFDFMAPLNSNGLEGFAQPANYSYRGPSLVVERIAYAVGAQGQILQIQPPSSNSSWISNFWAPTLQCGSVEDQDRNDIWANVWNFVNDSSRCDRSPAYLSWTPTARSLLPFDTKNGSFALRSTDLAGNTSAELYIAAMPKFLDDFVIMSDYPTASGCGLAMNNAYDNYTTALNKTGDYTLKAFFGNATLLKCQFYNMSYATNFDYVNGRQSISVKNGSYGNPRALVPLGTVMGPPGSHDSDSSTLNLKGTKCRFEAEIVRTLSYQAIADAFVRLIKGTVALGQGASFPAPPVVDFQTNVSKTVLLDTSELSFLQTYKLNDADPDLATAISAYNTSQFMGLSNGEDKDSQKNLAEALQDLFQNITLSLLSEKYLQPNYSSSFAPPKDEVVTDCVYRNIYVYDSQTLWIAYGLAIAFSTVAVAFGLMAMVLIGASYTNDFSTVLRISKSTDMSETMNQTEFDGREPLPRRLAEARVLIWKDDDVSEEAKSGEEGVCLEVISHTTEDSIDETQRQSGHSLDSPGDAAHARLLRNGTDPEGN